MREARETENDSNNRYIYYDAQFPSKNKLFTYLKIYTNLKEVSIELRVRFVKYNIDKFPPILFVNSFANYKGYVIKEAPEIDEENIE